MFSTHSKEKLLSRSNWWSATWINLSDRRSTSKLFSIIILTNAPVRFLTYRKKQPHWRSIQKSERVWKSELGANNKKSTQRQHCYETYFNTYDSHDQSSKTDAVHQEVEYLSLALISYGEIDDSRSIWSFESLCGENWIERSAWMISYNPWLCVFLIFLAFSDTPRVLALIDWRILGTYILVWVFVSGKLVWTLTYTNSHQY